MKKILFIYFIVFQSFLYACATCALMTPMVEVNLELQVQEKKLKNIHTVWNFSDQYSFELTSQYDKNKNGSLDKEELENIKNIKLDYLLPKNMVSKIEYAKDDEYAKELEAKYKNFEIKMEDEFLIFSYDAELDLDIEDQSILSVTFEDDEGFFVFAITDLNVSDSALYHNQNLYLFTASLLFSDTPMQDKNQDDSSVLNEENDLFEEGQVLEQPSVPVKKEENEKQIEVQEQETMQENLLQESMRKIRELFSSIKDETNPMTYLLLLLFAYAYGVIHALGPGHGKTLVASYFLSNEKSYQKALYISLAIGFVHTFSAFILTYVIYYVVNTLLAQFLNDTVYYTTKISAVIIIFIAMYLMYKKYRVYRAAKESQEFKFSTSPHIDSCACHACKVDKNSTDMALIISAGIIPCPGTTTIFIFAISLGLFYAGFISALVMSMGMSTVIFISAIVSVFVRGKTMGYGNLKKFLEYGSLFVIFFLGLVLLFS